MKGVRDKVPPTFSFLLLWEQGEVRFFEVWHVFEAPGFEACHGYFESLIHGRDPGILKAASTDLAGSA